MSERDRSIPDGEAKYDTASSTHCKKRLNLRQKMLSSGDFMTQISSEVLYTPLSFYSRLNRVLA